MARRELKPEEDTDKDGLADEWEMYWFKALKHDALGDEDGDGFPNIIEWYRGMNPLKQDILDPALKPAKLEDPPVPQTPWDIPWDIHSRKFWEIQDPLTPKPVKPKWVATWWDTDADGMRDADEFMVYGTLRYNRRTTLNAPTISFKPHNSRTVFVKTNYNHAKFYRMARGQVKLEEDTDKDWLPDGWEKHCFGDLKPGAYDDPDGDGFPNIIEWYRGTHPLRPDILDPSMKPAELEDGVREPKTPWDIPWDVHSRKFWEIQDRLAVEALAKGGKKAQEATGPKP
jgi:hypothetical protein